MGTIKVTIYNHLGEAFESELPDNIAIEDLLPKILEQADTPAPDAGKSWVLKNESRDNYEYNPKDTFASTNTAENDVLRVMKQSDLGGDPAGVIPAEK